MQCIEECQTFLWAGTGAPTIDAAGRCSCICGDEGWCDFNILGMASCVPIMAHVTFGALGLATSAAGLGHAVYQLNRQAKFHARQVTAAVTPIEDCRRHLHVVATAHGGLSLVYFILIFGLEGDQLWGSTILLAGVNQLTASIGGVLTTRMWIYANDPRLMQETPEILAISNMLERPVGQYTSYGVVCFGGVIGTVLAAANRGQAAILVATVAFIFLCVACNVIIRKCGTSLVSTIDGSLQNTSGNHQAAEGAPEEGTSHKAVAKKEGGDLNLLAARKKIKMAMSVCLMMAVQTIIMLLFAIFSGYGLAAPLLFFGVPMGMAPLLWFMFNIQLHAGRSKPRVQRGASSAASPSQSSSRFGEKLVSKLSSSVSRRNMAVVPTESAASPPATAR